MEVLKKRRTLVGTQEFSLSRASTKVLLTPSPRSKIPVRAFSTCASHQSSTFRTFCRRCMSRFVPVSAICNFFMRQRGQGQPPMFLIVAKSTLGSLSVLIKPEERINRTALGSLHHKDRSTERRPARSCRSTILPNLRRML